MTVITKNKKIILAVAAVVVLIAAGIGIAKHVSAVQHYNTAVSLMESGDYDAALTALEAANGHGDSAARIETCEAAIDSYSTAQQLIASADYDAAVPALEAAGGYRDADTELEICRAAIDSYAAAQELFKAGDYEAAAAAFEAAAGYRDADAQAEACRAAAADEAYAAAVSLMESGDYASALEGFAALDGYLDSAARITQCEAAQKVAELNIGDVISFGSFEQDNDPENGAEPIEWIILDKDGSRVFVISRYALYAMGYNAVNKNTTWETCTLRAWLNNDFVNAAFTSEELAAIPTVQVEPAESPKYHTDPGNATEDQVFLISIKELNQYFPTDADRELKPTAYAIAEGAVTKFCNGNCWWWLRSPGINQACAARVNCYGSLRNQGPPVTSDYSCVRPAMWIDYADYSL